MSDVVFLSANIIQKSLFTDKIGNILLINNIKLNKWVIKYPYTKQVKYYINIILYRSTTSI